MEYNMPKTSTAKKSKPVWGWESPTGKVWWQTYETKSEASNDAGYHYENGFKVYKVWVQPAK